MCIKEQADVLDDDDNNDNDENDFEVSGNKVFDDIDVEIHQYAELGLI